MGWSLDGAIAIYVPLPQLILPEHSSDRPLFGEEALARSAMYEALARIDPTIAPDITPMTTALDRVTLFARTITRLFAACGAFAILLAVAGIYGMSSNAVVLRQPRDRVAASARRRATTTSIAAFLPQGVEQLA